MSEEDDDDDMPGVSKLSPSDAELMAKLAAALEEKPKRGRPPAAKAVGQTSIRGDGGVPVEGRPQDNKVVKLLDKNPLGMTLPEMAGGPRQIKRIKTMRPLLAEAIRSGLVMPVSQRAGHTVYRLVKHIANR